MYRKGIYIVLLLFSQLLFAQEQQLANDYFRKGEFEKAAAVYENLYKENKHNTFFFQKLVKSYQAIEDFKKCEALINERLKTYPKQEFLWVELGYNHEIQHQQEVAETYYKKANLALKKNPKKGYRIARSFHDNHLLDYALEGYNLITKANPTANYNYQIAAIYGEKGDIEKMFDTYLSMISKQGGTLKTIQRFIGKYVTDDGQDSNNIVFRKLLIKRLQQNPKDEWNKLLSWLYIQQKDFDKALVQEKAVHKRSQTDLEGVIDIGKIAFDATDYTTSETAFKYILNSTNDAELKVFSQYYLLEGKKRMHLDVKEIEQAYQDVFKEYGKGSNTSKIQVSYAEFLSFYSDQPQKAIAELKTALKNSLSPFQKAEIKIQLADILVYTGNFNQALIKYSQVQTKLKNHVLAQIARYKVAQTSYFKGDFEWANIQLKVLKKGTTKLIANDAIDLSLLINDNTAQDTIGAALKTYATAELLSFQNKNTQALDTLSTILQNYKGHAIEDEAMYKQAQLFEKTGQYEAAEQRYLSLIALDNDDILIDDALFYLAKLYDTRLNMSDKAKTYYEKIIFEYPSSIYLVTARKRFRQLRGDVLMP